MNDLRLGDCLEVMKGLPSGSVDAVVTDPPYEYAFMGKKWDSTGIAFDPATWREVLRVMRPGTFLAAFGGTRTSHRMACAIEDAGFQIRDTIIWLHGQGFPKAKSCLKPGHEPIVLAYKPGGRMSPLQIDACRIGIGPSDDIHSKNPHTVGTIGANGIYGEGKPTLYDVPSGRWPANVVLSHSEGCRRVGTRRVKTDGHHPATRNGLSMWAESGGGLNGNSGPERYMADPDGRETVDAWECVEGCPVATLDAMSGERKVAPPGRPSRGRPTGRVWSDDGGWKNNREFLHYPDSGGASRFFATFPGESDPGFGYFPKASRKDRGEGNTHPTVKNTELCRWLCRLVTPPGGTILDPFLGSGSTGKAAVLEGFGLVGIERDPAYFAIAESRIHAAREAATA